MQILYSTSRKYLHCDGNNQNSHGEESSRGDTDLILFFDWCNSDPTEMQHSELCR